MTETPEELRTRLRAKHKNTPWMSACGTCGQPWPCDVARLLDRVDLLEQTLVKRP